ncbi:MAG: glutamate--tRNA ligase family protein, partial [Steroidobacter sp.]
SLESDELRYPGFCRQQPRHTQNEYAWRFRAPADAIRYHDAIHGESSTNLDASIGDFIVKRRDGLFAYQLAVVVDDAAQDISEVVRGGDLLSNTPRQIALQRALKLPTPNYVHLPVVLDSNGKKLSKSQQAPHLNGQNTGQNGSELLYRALVFLKQAPPINLQRASIVECWQWAIDNWQLKPLILS